MGCPAATFSPPHFHLHIFNLWDTAWPIQHKQTRGRARPSGCAFSSLYVQQTHNINLCHVRKLTQTPIDDLSYYNQYPFRHPCLVHDVTTMLHTRKLNNVPITLKPAVSATTTALHDELLDGHTHTTRAISPTGLLCGACMIFPLLYIADAPHICHVWKLTHTPKDYHYHK